MARLRRSAVLHGLGRPILAAASTALLLTIVSLTGVVNSAGSSLVMMGFDPDRAALITALLVAAFASSFAYLWSSQTVTSVGLGLLAATLLYADTFATETTSALASKGSAGVFDPGGWLLTVGTLVFLALVVSWSAVTLSRPARTRLVATGRTLAQVVRERRAKPRALAGPLSVAVICALLVVSVPTMGDLLNYTPDAHMLTGGRTVLGLGADQGVAPGASAPLWQTWGSVGAGQVVNNWLPAPWVGGKSVAISVYLPPGYAANAQRHYPVVYETQGGLGYWEQAVGIKEELDSLISSGEIPASIFAFIDTSGGPYVDSECADSVDGQEWMGIFIGQTVPAFVDANFRTIAKQGARTVLGFSQGGYCAAITALHYPDVFGNAVSFSGYFHAGQPTANVNSWQPFGHSQVILDRWSPAVVAPTLPATSRSNVYFVLDYNPTQPFYGTEAVAFTAVLKQAEYPYTALASPLKHSWTEVRADLGPALALVGDRQVQEQAIS
jgi:S-formylglutathione hydrolase FrmB